MKGAAHIDVSDDQLMRYLDGELPSEEARAIERALESPAVQTRVEALTQLGDIVRARYEVAADEAEPRLAAMWNDVRAALEPPPLSFWTRAREAWERYRSHLLTGAVAAAAGAFVAVIALPGRVERKIVYVPAPQRTGAPVVATAEEAEVESLEVVGGSGTVLHLPNDKDGVGTTVIWVSHDEPTEPEGPEGPI